ncbi:MAG TPA: TIR domain-containing protein, partial [Nitrososphaeraceae archaeon]|nr:TIR domain-containing protein [Nitrososphaeraceae archaeon]
MADTVRDIFICHASEDKSEIVGPIVHALAKSHLTCWYDEAEIDWGDSITEKINEGLTVSRYVLVVLSKNFLSKKYPQRELNAALHSEASFGYVRILPLLVGSTDEKQEILRKFPLISDKRYLSWTGNIEEIVHALESRLSGKATQAFVTSFNLDSPHTPSTIRPVPPQPYFNLAYHLLQGFIGRSSELDLITDWYSGQSNVLALIGIGGIGKSALVWYWIHSRLVNKNSALTDQISKDEQVDNSNSALSDITDGIFWWSFYDPKNTVDRFLDELLFYISAGELRDRPSYTEFDRLSALISILQKKRVLIVLDGFEKLLLTYSNAIPSTLNRNIKVSARTTLNHLIEIFLTQFAAYKPSSRLILTSRLLPNCFETIDGELIEGVSKLELLDLNEIDATEFLRCRGVDGTIEEFRRLFDLFGHHPLALRLIAGTIRNQVAISRGLAPFLHSYSELEIKDKGRHTSVVDIAFTQLSGSEAELLGRIAAFYGPASIEEVEVFSTFKSRTDLEKGLKRLIDLGLLQYDSTQSIFDLHPIIRQFAYARLTNQQEVHSLYAEYLSGITQNVSFDELPDMQKVIAFYYHLVMAGMHGRAVDLLFDRLWQSLYFELQNFELCFDLLMHLVDFERLEFSPSVPEGSYVVIYEALMLVCEKLGELEKCAKFASKAAERTSYTGSKGFDREFNPDSRSCFQLSYAGAAYRYMGKILESDAALSRAIEHGQKARDYFQGRLGNPMSVLLGGEYGDIGLEEVAVARARTELAILKAQKGDFEEALKSLYQAQEELKLSVSKSNYKEECIDVWRISAAKLALAASDIEYAKECLNLSRKHFDIVGYIYGSDEEYPGKLDTSGGYSATSHFQVLKNTVL